MNLEILINVVKYDFLCVSTAKLGSSSVIFHF